MRWNFHKIIFAFCKKCEGKRWHEKGHYNGEKITKKMCLKCYTLSEVSDEETKERNWC